MKKNIAAGTISFRGFHWKKKLFSATLIFLMVATAVRAAETPKEIFLEFENRCADLSVEEYLSYIVPAHRNKLKPLLLRLSKLKGNFPRIKNENIKIVKESAMNDFCEIEYQYTGMLPDGQPQNITQTSSTIFRKIDGKWYIDEYLTAQSVLRRNVEKMNKMSNPTPQELDDAMTSQIHRELQTMPRDAYSKVMNVVASLGAHPERVLDSTRCSPWEWRKLFFELGILRKVHLIVPD